MYLKLLLVAGGYLFKVLVKYDVCNGQVNFYPSRGH